MADQRDSSLRQDFRIFRDPGFLVTLAIIALLSAAGAGIIIYAVEAYGVPISPYWR